MTRRADAGAGGGLLLRTRSVREAEELGLAPAATRAAASRGREREEEPDPLRTAFERDRDRILHSKAFRRLKHKTQVFINPEGDHVVTRLTHTLQVAQIGRALATALGLNETLTEAICLGHDIGHSPFGHTGEDALTPYVPGEWLHSVQSVRVLRRLEPLNLSFEVLDGIRAHSWRIDPPPATPEGWCCRYADRIAYLAHDAQDAVRAGVLAPEELPGPVVEVLGASGREWIARMVTSVVERSARDGRVCMDDEVLAAMNELRDFMFERVYQRPDAAGQGAKAVKVIRDLVDWFAAHPDQVPAGDGQQGVPPVQVAVDYVAGMTDGFALRTHDALFRPTGVV